MNIDPNELKENLVAVEFPYNMEILISIEEAASLLKIFKNAIGTRIDFNDHISELNTPIKSFKYRLINNKEIDDFKIKSLLGVKDE